MKVHAITTLRNNGIHLSGIMIMCFISRLQTRTKSAYLAEIHCHYITESKRNSLRSYSKSGIRYMVKKLINQGYVRETVTKGYTLTAKGKFAIGMFV